MMIIIITLVTGVEMHIHVLTTGYWPTSPSAQGIILPTELVIIQVEGSMSTIRIIIHTITIIIIIIIIIIISVTTAIMMIITCIIIKIIIFMIIIIIIIIIYIIIIIIIIILFQEQFSLFYLQKYQGRRLAWSHALEKCIVTARFPKGSC